MKEYLTCIAQTANLWNNNSFDFVEYAQIVRDLSSDRRFRAYNLAYTNASGIIEYRGVRWYIYRDYNSNSMIVERAV